MQAGLGLVPAVASPPVITDQPDNETVTVGADVTLSVTATGDAPLTYQWYEDGVSMGGETNATLEFEASATADYYVIVTNAGGSTQSTTATVTVNVVPEDVLEPPTYLGCFRISADGLDNTGLSDGGCAGRKVDGTVHIFFTGDRSANFNTDTAFTECIIEVTDPESYSLDYNTAPIATTVFYTNEYRAQRGTWRLAGGSTFDNFEATPAANNGLYWDDDNELLYIGYADIYDVTSSQLHGMVGVELSDTQTSPPHKSTIGHGPWSIQITDGLNRTLRGPRAAMHFGKNPNTGDLIGGSSVISGSANCTWGPSLHFGTGVQFPTTSTPVGPSEILDLDTTGLHHYFMGWTPLEGGFQLTHAGLLQPGKSLKSFRRRVNPGAFEVYDGDGTALCPAEETLVVDASIYEDAIGFTGSWSDFEFISGVQWVNYGTKAGVLYFGVMNQGHSWYMNVCKPLCPSHGEAPPFQNTGPVSTDMFPFILCYDPATIQDVIDGNIDDWEAEPVWCENLGSTIQTAPMSTSGARTLGGGYFDTDTGKLYCVAHKTDDSRPPHFTGTIVHVFQFTG